MNPAARKTFRLLWRHCAGNFPDATCQHVGRSVNPGLCRSVCEGLCLHRHGMAWHERFTGMHFHKVLDTFCVMAGDAESMLADRGGGSGAGGGGAGRAHAEQGPWRVNAAHVWHCVRIRRDQSLLRWKHH